MSVPDGIGALVSFLKADSAVNTTTQGRVFGAELPASVTPSMPVAAVVIRPSGGLNAIGRAWQEYGDFRVDVSCYGTNPKAAHDLWRAVHPALKQLRREVRNDCLLHWARPAGGPLALRDGDTDWPYVFSSYQVLAAERAVA